MLCVVLANMDRSSCAGAETGPEGLGMNQLWPLLR